jgi:signal peptidase II
MSPSSEDGMPLGRKSALIAALAAAVVVVDLVTKAVFERAFYGQPTVHLLGDTVRVGFVLNTGVFLSLGHALGPEMRFWLFVVGVGGVLALLLGLTLKDTRFHAPEVVAVAAIVGGGVGNLVDRVRLGAVRDFLNVGIGPLRTGIFNVADMAITFGGIALILIPLVRKRPGGAGGSGEGAGSGGA